MLTNRKAGIFTPAFHLRGVLHSDYNSSLVKALDSY